jgi:hypothetical protein
MKYENFSNPESKIVSYEFLLQILIFSKTLPKLEINLTIKYLISVNTMLLIIICS